MKYLIVGLGNIGSEYENTRHNIGFTVADALALSLKSTFTSGRYGALATAKYKGRTLLILKPSTYMNLSGKAVKYWLNKEGLEKENILIVYDDVALPLGTLRTRKQGSDGGHNGMNNIIFELLSDEFPRLRFGIGNDFPKGYQVEYVLGKWTKPEEKVLLPRIESAVEIIKSYTTIGIDRTMNEYNNK